MYSFESVSTLELSSWNSIKLISELGVASQFFNVGDEKTITLTTSEEVTLVILGFNHDHLTSGGKAGITFGMKNLLANTYQMNSTDTNDGGWNGCYMRTQYMGTFFDQLPSDLQSAIKKVNKPTTGGRQNPAIITSQDKLFLFSEVEITSEGSAEGTQYDYWKGKGASARIKTRLDSANDWWLRSPRISSYYSFRYFNSGGNISNNDADDAFGVCFGFCV